MDAGCFGDVLEFATTLIMKDQNTISSRDCKISMAIVVIVTSGAGNGMQPGVESRFLRDLFEFSAAGIMKQRHSSLRAAIREKQIRMPVIIKIQKACSRAGLTRTCD